MGDTSLYISPRNVTLRAYRTWLSYSSPKEERADVCHNPAARHMAIRTFFPTISRHDPADGECNYNPSNYDLGGVEWVDEEEEFAIGIYLYSAEKCMQ